MRKIHLLSLVLPLLAIAGVGAQSRNADGARSLHGGRAAGVIAIPLEEPADSLYRLGREAINNGDYRRAASLFKDVADRYPQSRTASDALYWRAWSLHKLGVERRNTRDLDDALASIDRLEKDYPKATMLADAGALRGTIRSAQAAMGNAAAASDVAREAKGLTQQRACPGSSADAEMRMAALDGLLSMNSDDAIPILQDVLKQRDPCRVELRKKAVFLLSQKRGDAVTPTLLEVARNDPSTEVRGDAIQWLSQSRSDAAIPALDSVLFQSKDSDIRKKALFALSQLSRDERARAALRRAAESDQMPSDVREDAIFWLGQGRTVDLDFFKELFRKTPNVDLRKKITFSVSQHDSPEATAWLLAMAKDRSYDIDVRKDAIFWLSQRRSTDMNALQSIYDGARDDTEIQKQVIFAYSQRRESAAVDKLMAIAKSDPSIAMRKEAIFWLGQKNDPRVKQFLRDLING
jgi:HEAT repeat protein